MIGTGAVDEEDGGGGGGVVEGLTEEGHVGGVDDAIDVGEYGEVV